MKKLRFSLPCALMLGAAAQAPDTTAAEGYRFTDVKVIPVDPVKDQSRSGTCWCYSTLSFLESEILRAGGRRWTSRKCGSSATYVSKRP